MGPQKCDAKGKAIRYDVYHGRSPQLNRFGGPRSYSVSLDDGSDILLCLYMALNLIRLSGYMADQQPCSPFTQTPTEGRL